MGSELGTNIRIGVLAHGAYLPHHRLRRDAIADVLGVDASATGARSVASYDEDSTTMAVEASRIATRRVARDAIEGVYFATASPAYLDKTNANAIHAALGLAESSGVVDIVGAVRSAAGAWRAALDAAAAGRTTLAAFADVRIGLPGGSDEREGGDAASAIVFGSGDGVIAELIGFASRTREFLDRWRLPEEQSCRVWEERFGEQVYVPLAERCVAEVVTRAGLSPGDIDHLVVSGLHARAARRLPKVLGLTTALVDDRTDAIGNSGTAQGALVLSDLLDRVDPGRLVLVVNLADGADAMLLRTTDRITDYQRVTDREHAERSVGAQLARTVDTLRYAQYLSWRQQLVREAPRRADPNRPMAPVANRRDSWKFAFVGSVCEICGTRHLPPQRICFACGAGDSMAPEPFADSTGSVSTFTVDRLAYSPSPPVVGAVVDFDGGGRYQCEVTDIAVDDVQIGRRVEPTFRRLYTAGGIHDYFWKVRGATS